jgi:hypothetical protein
MPTTIVFCFLISLICVIVGLYKSKAIKTSNTRHRCASCGWTSEPVRSCHVEQDGEMVVVPLCFECAMEHEAMPVKGSYVLA